MSERWSMNIFTLRVLLLIPLATQKSGASIGMCLKLEHDDFENRGLFFETKTTVYAPYSTGEKVIWEENMVLV